MELDPEKSITFTTESRLENVSLVGVAIKAICEFIQLAETLSYNIELSVVEGVTNVIKHAYGLQQGNNVEITVLIFGDRVTIKISDTGKGMDPQRREDCRGMDFESGDSKTLPVGGMGLHIMRSVMDEMYYETNSGKNIMTLVKRFK
ncbi:MAG: ATP-binding protein [Deltaproteobacteria bacterium]